MNDNPNDKCSGLLQRLKERGIKEPPLDLSSIYRVIASARWSPDEADTDDDAGQKPERAAVVKPEREGELLLLDDAAAYLNVTDDQVSAFVAGWLARLHQCRSRQQATALPFHQARP